MAPAPPTLADLQVLADRAAAMLEAGQATALWERAGERETFTVAFTAVRDGRAGEMRTEALDETGLSRAAKAAWLRAGQARAWPAAPLPRPAAGAAHAGFDPAALSSPGLVRDRCDGVEIVVETGAARVAVASTAGVRGAEERSHSIVRAGGETGERSVRVTRAAIGPIDPEAALAEAAELLEAGSAGAVPQGAPVVVLGPEAVAWVLDRLRPALGVDAALGGGPLAGRNGTRIAAPGIHLTDAARHPDTLPRSYDAEGLPRRAVVLIEDGVARGTVLDSAAAHRLGEPSTGHATRPAAIAPYPDHLVLAGGDADDVPALAATIRRGLFIPAFGRDDEGDTLARGARLIEDGRLGAGAPDAAVDLDPLAVLAATEALTRGQRLVALRGHAPGGIGAALVPALRAAAGAVTLR